MPLYFDEAFDWVFAIFCMFLKGVEEEIGVLVVEVLFGWRQGGKPFRLRNVLQKL